MLTVMSWLRSIGAARFLLAALLVMAGALAVSLAAAAPARIDATDIRKATLHAMGAAVAGLARSQPLG